MQISSNVRPYFVVIAAVIVLVAVAAGVKLWRHTATCAAQAQSLPLRSIADIDAHSSHALPTGALPRMDFQTIDANRGTLYVAYSGASEILVVDLKQNKVVGHISDLHSVHGALVIPSLHRLYAAESGANRVATIDVESQRVIARTAVGAYPDGIAYDPRDRKIFVSDAHATTDSVVDEKTNRSVGTIDLGSEPGNTQYDPVSRRVYTTVGTRNELVSIDPKADRVVARYPLAGCEHAHGLLLDSPNRLAFVACEGNARLIVLDMTTWKEQSTYPVGGQPDILAFDGGLQRLYVAAESGDVAVFREENHMLQPLGVGCLAQKAHTVAVDQKTHRVYFALQNADGRPVIRVMEPSKINS